MVKLILNSKKQAYWVLLSLLFGWESFSSNPVSSFGIYFLSIPSSQILIWIQLSLGTSIPKEADLMTRGTKVTISGQPQYLVHSQGGVNTVINQSDRKKLCRRQLYKQVEHSEEWSRLEAGKVWALQSSLQPKRWEVRLAFYGVFSNWFWPSTAEANVLINLTYMWN